MDCDVVCPCIVGAPATDRKYLGAVTSRSEKDGVAKLTSEDWPSYSQCMHQARGFLTATGESSLVETRSATRGRSDLQRPSMAQYMAKGRRTEIDFINGLIVERGREMGRPAPANARLHEVVKRVERGDLPARAENFVGGEPA